MARHEEGQKGDSMNPVLASTKFIAENSEMVQINEDRALEFAHEFTEKNVKHWFDQSPVDINRLSKPFTS